MKHDWDNSLCGKQSQWDRVRPGLQAHCFMKSYLGRISVAFDMSTAEQHFTLCRYPDYDSDMTVA